MEFQGKLKIQTQGNGKKPHFGPNLGPLDPNSGGQFFLQNLASSVTIDIMVSYHHVQYLKKTNDLILRKFSDRRADGQTDRQTDDQE